VSDPGPSPSHEIPADRLPDGFAERLDEPVADPAVPRPAATAVLLREGGRQGMELLLLRRTRTAGFVPGAYVFPGGRVDAADASPAALARVRGATEEELARRLDLVGAEPPAGAYLLAAIRETFEETGILPGASAGAGADPDFREGAAERVREALLEGRRTLAEVLEELDLDLEMGPGRSAYIAHWVTPAAEPRRYDTRFFAFRVTEVPRVSAHAREIAEARWLAPGEALRMHAEGKLPMVFPTVRTLEDLRAFDSPEAAIEAFRSRRIPRIEPRLVRTPTGVGIEVPDEEP
jgi:8-oxo-dGTP pyrophosphatase MutT (NUDIX family)